MLLIALLIAGTQPATETYPAEVINQSEYVGYWSAPPWKIYEYRTGDGGFCTVYSDFVRTPMGSYQLALTFGSTNELALVTSAPLASSTSEGAIDFENGDGFDWHDMVAHKLEKPNEDQLTYWYGNTMSSGMVQKLIAEMKHGKTAVFTYAGSQFPFSLSGFTQAYSDMKLCENHRIGRVLED